MKTIKINDQLTVESTEPGVEGGCKIIITCSDKIEGGFILERMHAIFPNLVPHDWLQLIRAEGIV